MPSLRLQGEKGGAKDKKQSWVKTWPRINVADVCARKGREGGQQCDEKKPDAARGTLATRGHYGKAETVIHCSKKDEIARERGTK